MARLINFEGGDGAGKSTQALMLAARLESTGVGVALTREPGGTFIAELLRHVLLAGAAKSFGAEAEALLFAIARGDHVRNIIEPALAWGVWVICDRFIDSTRAYQGGLGRDDLIRVLEQIAVGERKPDLTFVLDVPAEVGLARARARSGEQPDRFEAESLAFHETLREAYRRLVAAEPLRCVAIDATEPKPAVAERIWEIVTERFVGAPAISKQKALR